MRMQDCSEYSQREGSQVIVNAEMKTDSLSFCVVLVTCPTQETATILARSVVQARLVACVNLIQGVTSIYEWEDNVCESREILMVMKTQPMHLDDLYEHLRPLHPYTVPEFIVLPILAGSQAYLEWLNIATI